MIPQMQETEIQDLVDAYESLQLPKLKNAKYRTLQIRAMIGVIVIHCGTTEHNTMCPQQA